MKLLAFVCLLPSLAFGQFVPPANDLPGDGTVEGNHIVKGTSDLQGAVSNSTGDVTISDNLKVSGTEKLTGTGTNTITSDTTAANATTTVGAFTMKPTATLGVNDLVLDLESAASAHLFTVDLEGDATFAGGISATTGAFSSTLTSTVASGGQASTKASGSKICLEPACNVYIDDDGYNGSFHGFAGGGWNSTVFTTAGYYGSNATGGNPGFKCLIDDCRIELGTNAAEYIAGNGANGISFSGGAKYTPQTIVTCSSGLNGLIQNDSTKVGGTATKICVCTYNGTTAAWRNMLNPVVSGVGNTTTCPDTL